MNLGYFLTVGRLPSPHVFPSLCFIGLHKAAARRSSTLRISVAPSFLDLFPLPGSTLSLGEAGRVGNN